MSRRKQAKPQHLRAEEGEEEEEQQPQQQQQQQEEEEEEEEEAQRGADTPAHRLGHDAMEGEEREEPSENTSGSEETHVCDRCCAEFFSWAELSQHRRLCSHHQLVLIVKDAEGAPAAGSPPAAPAPSPPRPPSAATSDSSAAESASGAFDALGNEESPEEAEEAMETEGEKFAPGSSPPPGTAETPPTAAGGYAIPSTNVTLEILHSTRVAVAQFSQGLSGGGGGGVGRAASAAAIPLILEHLLALQQQQVQQLQLIEQICSQVAVINRQPTQAALNPAPRSLPAPAPVPTATAAPPPAILPLSGTTPSNVNGQAAAPYEKPHALPPQSSQSAFRDVPGGVGGAAPVSALLPAYAGPRPGSRSPTLSSGSPLSLGQSALLGPSSSSSSSSSSLPFLPQSPPSGVIFPNPLASIAATANALDPLAALVKHRKGKLSLFAAEAKPGPEEPFFKHKCRFCAKVFGSDSALQIHLRSHTGERPFKCNICGNRFSTKGNLKVHFQRHKEKYPHVQMNPYPVPEYLDNVPTSSGIPYGMSVPPEKPVSSWLDSKPVVAALPASLGLPLSSTITSPAVSNDPVSVTPSLKSPHQPAPGECASLSPEQRGSEAHFSPVSESPQSNRETDGSGALKTEVIHLPQNCTLRLRASLEASGTAAAATAPSLAATPEPSPSPVSASASASPPLSSHSLEDAKVPACGPLDSMQTSETSKLQQLVENIDKKITDPNQCVLCHRVLSCQSALKMHYRIHTGERPFRCKVCGRAFTTKGNLKTHVGVHRENPPVHVQHSCPICQKKFTNAVVLQQHIRMHMVGRIPDVEADAGDRSLDALSCNDSDFMEDVSMEEENAEEGDDTENMEEESPLKPLDSPLKTGLSHLAVLENQMRLLDSAASLHRSLSSASPTNGFGDAAKCSPSEKKAEGSASNSASDSSGSGALSPLRCTLEGQTTKSPSAENRLESQDPLATLVKREEVESPSSAPVAAAAAGGGGELRGKLCVKEESPYSFQMRDRGPSVPGLVPSTLPLVKTESLSHGQTINPSEGRPPPPLPPFAVHVPPAYPAAVGGPGMALLGPAPPRRAPKQHNCNVCGKNFSSASALQIHERTHTGEKPFVCSICGRAFTTKGNLKVHMGTHMWNNAPARRGRRLSVENPMALLGGEAAKLGHMFQKDLAARAMNVDAGFWSRYATAITNSLAIKSNEISVIQNRGITPLHPMGAGVERLGAAAGALTKSAMELGGSRHFSMLIDDSKEIGIN